MLMLHRGDRVSEVTRTLCYARSSVGRWINGFTLSGVAGLKSLPAGRTCRLGHGDFQSPHRAARGEAD